MSLLHQDQPRWLMLALLLTNVSVAFCRAQPVIAELHDSICPPRSGRCCDRKRGNPGGGDGDDGCG